MSGCSAGEGATCRWLSYGELAWTEPIIGSPESYADEAGGYVEILNTHARIDIESLLHLGCGAGGHDYTLKHHYDVTGVDVSEQMLDIARALNPEVTYIPGDMRSIDLGRRFDAVAIPDAIDYMVTLADLETAITAASRHLRPGGVLLVVAKTREEFQENDFCYKGARGDVEITLFENNYVLKDDPSTYHATLVYLIRIGGRLSIYTDCHTLGLFSRAQWRSVLGNAGLEVTQMRLEGLYETFIMGEGSYPMQVFAGVKPFTGNGNSP